MSLKKLVSKSRPTANQLTIRQNAFATPPDSDLEDVQLRKMLKMKDKHSERESLMIHSSLNPEVSGKPDAVYSWHSQSSQNTFSERDRSSELGNRFESSVHSVFNLADLQMLERSLLEGDDDHVLSQARSELMKQEHQVGSLNCCIDELQQKAYAQGLELQDAHHGYVESRREQVRLQEESSLKERALRGNSETEYTRDGRNEESARITSRRILCTEIEEVMRQ